MGESGGASGEPSSRHLSPARSEPSESDAAGVVVLGDDEDTARAPSEAISPTEDPPAESRGFLSPYAVHQGKIDYLAAGAAMRSQGYGTIDVSWTGALVAAYLVWGFMGDLAHTSGTVNGVEIVGTVVARDANHPCWKGHIHTLVADVTALVANGANDLEDFPSNVTSGEDPWWHLDALPLMQGASLIVVFEASGPWRQVTLLVGANTLSALDVLTQYVPHAYAETASAQTTFIVSDGQQHGNEAVWNRAIVDADAFPGEDPRASTKNWSKGNLWDTATYPVSVGVGSKQETARVSNLATGDCLTWHGQVLRVDAAELPPDAGSGLESFVGGIGRPPPDNLKRSDMDGAPIAASPWVVAGSVSEVSESASPMGLATADTSTCSRVPLGALDPTDVNDPMPVPGRNPEDRKDKEDAPEDEPLPSSNRRPIANAGPDRDSVPLDSRPVLDGTGSIDPDGDSLTFAWVLTVAPSSVNLESADSATPAFAPTAPGTYVFSLTVSDGAETSAADSVSVRVIEAGLPVAPDSNLRVLLLPLAVLFLLAVVAAIRRSRPDEDAVGG